MTSSSQSPTGAPARFTVSTAAPCGSCSVSLMLHETDEFIAAPADRRLSLDRDGKPTFRRGSSPRVTAEVHPRRLTFVQHGKHLVKMLGSATREPGIGRRSKAHCQDADQQTWSCDCPLRPSTRRVLWVRDRARNSAEGGIHDTPVGALICPSRPEPHRGPSTIISRW